MTHPFPFDPTYGYDEAALRKVGPPPAPPDFAEFWRQTYALAKAVPTRPTRRLLRQSKRISLHEVNFNAWSPTGPVQLGGWMTAPADGNITAGLVVGHGYGGRTAPDLSPLIPHAAVLYPCARGFNRSARSDLPDTASRHVLHGIESRDTYLHRGCTVDLWAAAWALMELEPASAKHLCYAGASFGGGIGALALPWEPAFKRAFLDYPSFGNYPLRLRLPCVGSGESVRQNGGLAHLPVLQYFDAATAAQHTHIPVMVAAALLDPAVPPPGQFSVYNALAGDKKLLIRQSAHVKSDRSGAIDKEIAALAAAWLQS